MRREDRAVSVLDDLSIATKREAARPNDNPNHAILLRVPTVIYFRLWNTADYAKHLIGFRPRLR